MNTLVSFAVTLLAMLALAACVYFFGGEGPSSPSGDDCRYHVRGSC